MIKSTNFIKILGNTAIITSDFQKYEVHRFETNCEEYISFKLMHLKKYVEEVFLTWDEYNEFQNENFNPDRSDLMIKEFIKTFFSYTHKNKVA